MLEEGILGKHCIAIKLIIRPAVFKRLGTFSGNQKTLRKKKKKNQYFILEFIIPTRYQNF